MVMMMMVMMMMMMVMMMIQYEKSINERTKNFKMAAKTDKIFKHS